MKRRLLIDSVVLEFVGKLTKRDRNFLQARFELIRIFPAHHADFHGKDETGRDLDGHVAGRFAIMFWDDPADHHVKIMHVTFADKVG